MALNRRGPRGFYGPGGGAWRVLPTPPTYRGTSVQVCGFWPFAGGSSRPRVGVPVGQDISTGATVCCDVFTWFRHGLISSPSMAVYGLNGYGKSTWTLRQAIGAAAQGAVPIFCGDLKNEYSEVTEALGGTVVSYGQNERLNVLDLGAMADAADRIGGEAGEELRGAALERAALMVASLAQIARKAVIHDFEFALLAAAIRLVHDRHHGGRPPVLSDLVALTQNPTQELMDLVVAADEAEYRAAARDLNRSLQALIRGRLGTMFDGQTTARLDLNAAAVNIDISDVQRRSDDVLAAVMLATWSEVFATIEASNALADAGVAPQRHFLTVMDEMWRPMRLEGAGLVEKLDAITRLNRNDGVGHIFVTHSPKDLESMSSTADVRKAQGFTERAGIVVTAALATDDLRALSRVRKMSEEEIQLVSSWSTPTGWQARSVTDPTTGQARKAPPPDAGKVLIKLGQRAGIATQVKITPTEQRLHDTDRRW